MFPQQAAAYSFSVWSYLSTTCALLISKLRAARWTVRTAARHVHIQPETPPKPQSHSLIVLFTNNRLLRLTLHTHLPNTPQTPNSCPPCTSHSISPQQAALNRSVTQQCPAEYAQGLFRHATLMQISKTTTRNLQRDRSSFSRQFRHSLHPLPTMHWQTIAA